MSLVISKQSQLGVERIERYLVEATLPLRLAVNTEEGTPLVASHWYLFRGGELYCALHKSSLMARHLGKDGRCAFEVGSDQVPYCGVRGQAVATLQDSGVEELLKALLTRYEINPDSRLAKWLLGRAAEERIVRIKPNWVSGWDFSERMADAQA